MQTLIETCDEWGTIQVKDDGTYRVLAFADGDEQSRQLKAQPQILQHEYTQAMLLVLLFCTPARVALLGLGGGCLATALHFYQKGVHITAVELRASVIHLAYQYFQLPNGKKLQVINQEAGSFIKQGLERKVDVIFTDLYHAQGVDAVQLRQAFIAHCADNLKAEGWLVLNCWQEHQHNPDLISILKQYFTDIRSVLTTSHNWVVLAGKVPNQDSYNTLKHKAHDLAGELGFPLYKHLTRLDTLT